MSWDVSYWRIPAGTPTKRVRSAAPYEGAPEQWHIELPDDLDISKLTIAPRIEIVRFLIDWGAKKERGADTFVWRKSDESLVLYIHDDPVSEIGTNVYACLETLFDLRRRLNDRWPQIIMMDDGQGHFHDEWTIERLGEEGEAPEDNPADG